VLKLKEFMQYLEIRVYMMYHPEKISGHAYDFTRTLKYGLIFYFHLSVLFD
jgi:hypothetical protein